MVEDYVISYYNHPMKGDYNTEALILKMASTRFLDVSEEETNKMKENAVALIITCTQAKWPTLPELIPVSIA